MPTDKQIEANRANARKSTGPKTPAGKARACLNGLRHRLLAKSYLIAGEDTEAFTHFVEAFHSEFNPQTASETAMVNGMATARWRLIRVANLEAVQIDQEAARLNQQAGSFAERSANAHRQAVAASRSIEILGRAEARLQRQFESNYDRLQILQTKRLRRQNDPEALVPPGAICNPNPIFETLASEEFQNESIT